MGGWRDEDFWQRLEVLQAACGGCPCCGDGAVGLQDTTSYEMRVSLILPLKDNGFQILQPPATSGLGS